MVAVVQSSEKRVDGGAGDRAAYRGGSGRMMQSERRVASFRCGMWLWGSGRQSRVLPQISSKGRHKTHDNEAEVRGPEPE